MLCILYVTLLAAGLGLIGLLVERALPATAPRRWIWCLSIAASTIIPPVYRARHNASLTAMAQQAAEQGSSHHMAGITRHALDPAWWSRTESLDTAINQLWLLSSGTLLLLGLVSMGRVTYLVWRSRARHERPSRAEVLDGVPVVITESLGPATVGLVRSRVLIPRWVLALPMIQRRYVLRHEDEHRRAQDARLLFFASLPLLLVPWNLPLWWQVRRLRLAIEMDCDTRVVAALGDAPRYGDLLLKVALAESRGPRLQPAFLGRVGMLERRLTHLLDSVPRGYLQRVVLPLAAAALLLLVLSMPHPVVDAPAAHESAVQLETK
jgi:bla regulator protein blaR1